MTAAAVERAALEAVAAHFPAAGGRIAAEVATIRKRIAARDGLNNPRLRFDGVALRVVRDLQAALRDSVPHDRTLVVTVTAPIRKSSKTVAALVDAIGRRLARGHGRIGMKAAINANQVQARLVKDVCGRASKVIGFVHNPDSDPEVLFGVTEILLRRIGAAAARPAPKRISEARWLVIADATGLAHAATYRRVCDQLALATGFEKILLLLADGRVETLAGRD